MLKSIDSPPYHCNFRSSLQNSSSLSYIPGTIQQPLYDATIPAKNEICSLFVPVLLALRKGIVENNGRFTKDAKPLCEISALFPVRQRQPHQELKACHRKLAAGRSLDPVLGREPALALDSLLPSNH